jgi:flagellar biosynthesis/type III secretory pathway M-ring protein FliF/YscJ
MFQPIIRHQTGKGIFKALSAMSTEEAAQAYTDMPDEEKEAYLTYLRNRNNLDIVKSVAPYAVLAVVVAGGVAVISRRYSSEDEETNEEPNEEFDN